ncbi:MAG: replicative DNA helicase [Clostridia bacterium]|nr:replicative DNA helicase [Clostridia bacterium]MBP3555442.1 replicative DNA helicase [Clostridia bacterium]MBQ8420204.1 replicative DNA helicase [Clostridia bacterium]
MADMQRNLPCALEAEQSVLGSILIDPNCFADLTEILRAEDFYLEEHGEIFYAMYDLFSKSREIDLVTLIDTLVSRGVYNEEESKKYIKIIAETVPSAANVLDYAQIVKEKSLLRSLIGASDEIREMAFSAQGEVKDIIDSAEQKVFAIAQGSENKGFVHIREAISRTYARLDLLARDKAAASGTPTGFSALDRTLVGLGEGDLVIVGARPGMGKTSFCMNLATNIAKSTKKNVCVFSLEMSAEQLASRMLSSEALVDSYAIRSGELTSEQYKQLADAAAELSESNILIDDTTGITVTRMKAKLRRVKNLGLVVVDYLQLMQGEGRRTDNRVLEVGDISRGLKILAKELKIPVICCAQLSRGPESRTDKRPMLSDLRDSGAIEQDADIILFLYRDEYYKEPGPGEQSVAECIVSKNRHGSTGTVKLSWIGQFTKFLTQEVTREDEAP